LHSVATLSSQHRFMSSKEHAERACPADGLLGSWCGDISFLS
jgi:hypothetical protein